jgi:flavin reductase (DIM6/NTAB) family NADH-FMN oxidoreductase RutF
MECRVLQVIPILEDGKLSTIVIGKVVGVHVRDEFVNVAGGFDTLKAKPLLRMGGTVYATIGEITGALGRPSPGQSAA